MAKNILIVEDEKDLVKLLKYNLEKEGFKVLSAPDGEAGLKLLRQERPDLVILDIMLPKVDGFEFLKLARREFNTPILVLTAKKEEVDKVLGLELGADDYVTKPFSVREVVTRVKTILRRAASPSEVRAEKRIGDLRVDFERYEIRNAEKPVNLNSKEFELLKCLVEADGKVLSREKILEQVWGYGDSLEIDTRTVDQHVSRLRDKLGRDSSRIVTVKNIGYRIKLD